jgi:hypothetical protein
MPIKRVTDNFEVGFGLAGGEGVVAELEVVTGAKPTAWVV